MRKFVGMTNKQYVLKRLYLGRDDTKKIKMPCAKYIDPSVQCGLLALCFFEHKPLDCAACFNKPVKKANGHYVLREVKDNAGN